MIPSALHLTEATGCARLFDQVEFPLDGQLVPVQALAYGEVLGFAKDLPFALAEGLVPTLRNRMQHHCLLAGVVADPGTRATDFVGQNNLEVGMELVDLLMHALGAE